MDICVSKYYFMDIRKLAKKLNLSITTVSRALGGYSDVSETTRKKVIKELKRWSGKLIEVPYTKNISSSKVKKGISKIGKRDLKRI